MNEQIPTEIELLRKRFDQFVHKGKYEQAIDTAVRAYELGRQYDGGHPFDFARSITNQAGINMQMGRYRDAEPLFLLSLDIRRKTVGETDPAYARSLNNLAGLYRRMGSHTEAELLYQQALEIRRVTPGEDSLLYARSLQNLASLYQEMGRYREAEPLLHESLWIYRANDRENTRPFAIALDNLARIHDALGESREVEPLIRQALEIRRNALGADHPSVAPSFNNLAWLHHRLGRYDKAEPLYLKALHLQRTTVGEQHPIYSATLHNLACLYAATDRETESLALMERIVANDRLMIGQVFSFGSETQRMAYLKIVQQRFYSFLSLCSQFLEPDQEATVFALDVVLSRKAIGAEAMAMQRDTVLGGRYPALKPKVRELGALRSRIADVTMAGPGPEGQEAHRRQLAEWTAQQESMEKELVRQIPEMSLEEQIRSADRRAVADALPEDAVLVEFVRFDVYDFEATYARDRSQQNPPRYLAFVLHAGDEDNIAMIDLGQSDSVDAQIAKFRSSITGEPEQVNERGIELPLIQPDHLSVRSDRAALRSAMTAFARHLRPERSPEIRADWTEQGIALRQSVFDPLEFALDGRTRLFLAPDGDLARLPFEVLPIDKDRCLIDKYQISYLSVGRDVLRFDRPPTDPPPATPLVFADPDFDLAGNTVPAFARGDPFPSLEGTHREGKQIADLLDVEPAMGDRALETELKSCRSPRILHIATHGFFLSEAPQDPSDRQSMLATIDGLEDSRWARMARTQSPLLRSGLALAGANTWLQEGSLPSEARDGILTAEDVTGLDLLATELVVLSACETGLGEVQVGEGVFGLRRSFVLAGAKTLVMSLWKVPDRQTQELMVDFYQRILAGERHAEALRQAQLAMKERYPDPLYWGAFICQGDPGPLPELSPKARW